MITTRNAKNLRQYKRRISLTVEQILWLLLRALCLEKLKVGLIQVGRSISS